MIVSGPTDMLVFAGNGNGTFGMPSHFPAGEEPDDLTLGDFNRDGRTDMAVGNVGPQGVSILLNTGLCAESCSGKLGAPTTYPTNGSFPVAGAVGDLNADGKLDVVVPDSGEDIVDVFLGNGDGTLGAGTSYTVGPPGTPFTPYAVAIADFNRDGKQDFATANSASTDVSIFLGVGDGTFPDNPPRKAAGANPAHVAAGDFNRDGKIDLAVAVGNDTGNVAILIGNGDGTFADASNFAVGQYPDFIAVADFNRDGKLDLAVANGGSLALSMESVSILLGNGSGGFGTATNFPTGTGSFPSSIAVGDLDRDGKLDLAVSEGEIGNVAILMGNGDGTFTIPTAPDDQVPVGSAFEALLLDIHGDGKLDLASAAGDSGVVLKPGLGDGTFRAGNGFDAGAFPFHLASGDMNGDGKLDIITTNPYEVTISILLNECAPDLIVTKTHTGNFTQGDTGKTYTITVTNSGAVPTIGTVLLNDYLPNGLTVASISGSGWACSTFFGPICSRSDALAGLSSYPPITLTVNVNSDADTTETNSVEAVGGGEFNPTNNTSDDPTTVNPSVGMIAPTNTDAFAISPSQVNVEWNEVTGAAQYEVHRMFNRGTDQIVATPATCCFIDSSLAADTAYIYYVKARDAGSAVGPASNSDLATTVIFAPITPGTTVVTAAQFNQLRTAITAVRVSAPGVPAVPFAEAIAPGVVIKASHMTEMQTRLNEGLTALGFSSIGFVLVPAPAPGVTIFRLHIRQLQIGVE